MRKTKTAITRKSRRGVRSPITYHATLEQKFAQWAAACRMSPAKLRRLSEVAIRTRHHEAGRTDDFYYMTVKDFESAPYMLCLRGLERVYVYYRREGVSYLIRGYGWDFRDAYGEQESDEKLGVGGYYRS